MSVSADVLREKGPLTLREVTSESAIRLRATLHYEDVAAVLGRDAEDGKVRLVEQTRDYRDDVWEVSS